MLTEMRTFERVLKHRIPLSPTISELLDDDVVVNAGQRANNTAANLPILNCFTWTLLNATSVV